MTEIQTATTEEQQSMEDFVKSVKRDIAKRSVKLYTHALLRTSVLIPEYMLWGSAQKLANTGRSM